MVDEYAADIVRSIYRRKLEGMSANSIADQLNSEGVLAPSEYKRLCGLNYHSGFKTGTHAKWQAIQVLRILKNEVYTGTMVQGKRQKINYKIKKIRDVDESCWIKELKNLKGEKMRMYEEYAAGTLSLDNYKNKKQEYDRKIAEVQDKIEQSKVEEAAQSVVPGTVRAAAEQAENFLHGTRLTASMVSAFIENVYVHEGGRIVVQFKYEQSIQDAVRALHTD